MQEKGIELILIVYHDATKPYPENKYLSTRQIKVGDYDAIELVGKYIEPNLGRM